MQAAALGIAIGTWIGLTFFAFPAINKLETAVAKQEKAIQVLCLAAQKQFAAKHNYDIPLDCETIERL